MSSSSYYAPEAPRGGKTELHNAGADDVPPGGNYAFKNGTGGTGGVEIDDMMYGTTVATSSASVRLGFIRKVYGILSFQLLITVFTCAAFMYIPVLRSFIIAAGAFGQILLLVASLVTIFGLVMNKDSHPANMRWLIAFTLAESCTIGFLCALYQKNGLGGLVLEAFAITLAIFAGLTAYCFITKKDFSFMGGALYAALMVLLGAMLVNGLLGFTGHRSGAFSMVIACGGALLFSLYILYDTSLIMHNLQPDDYIMGAITLYLDIINLFLYILQILSSSQRD